MLFNFMKPVNVCDICGAPNALLRTFTDENDNIVDALSGYTCQECLDIEDDYIENLVEELDGNQELRDQLTERFQRIRFGEKANFICDHGQGAKHEKCEICGQGYSYLCVFEDHFDGHIETLGEISGWYCADCITSGVQQTHSAKALHELMMFRKECKNVIEKHEFFTSVAGTSQFTKEVKKNAISTFKHWKKLKVQGAEYKKKAERMEKSRLAYADIPVKMVFKTAKEGDICSICGKIYGKDHRCGDD